MINYKSGDEIREGNIVVCENDHEIATVTKDCYAGMIVSVDLFEFKQRAYKAGDVISDCEICNKPFAINKNGFIYLNLRTNDKT